MKVIDETSCKVPFLEIEIGECFKAKNSFYIKTIESIAPSGYPLLHFNSVDVETGDLEWFIDDFKVVPVEGEIHFRSKT